MSQTGNDRSKLSLDIVQRIDVTRMENGLPIKLHHRDLEEYFSNSRLSW